MAENKIIDNEKLENEVQEQEQETYTKEDVERLLQSEVDRRISSAQKKWEKQQQKNVAEAERLAKMSEEERTAEKIKNLQLQLEERERDLNLRENKVACLKIMDEQNIPSAFVDYIVDADADVMNDRLKTFKRTLDKLITEEVTKRIGGTTPVKGTKTDTLTKDSFNKLSLMEQQKLYETDKDLYNSLVK